MDNTSFQQNMQKKRSFFSGMWVFDSILSLMWRPVNWLASLLKVTDEEKEDAGVYLGRLGDE